MAQHWVRKELWIKGMISDTNELKLENALNSIEGITDTKAS
jgi:hypothetical protein